MVSMSTRPTAELTLALAVRLLGMTARMTSLRCMSWVNEYHRYALESCLVGDEVLQLIECPTQSLRSLRLPNRGARVDMRQVFHRDRPLAVFGFLNKMLGDTVIFIRAEAMFLARHSLQLPLR